MVLAVHIEDHEIADVALYKPLPTALRLDVLPFALLYATATYIYCVRPADSAVATLFFTFIVFCHALAFLSAEWSVDASAWMTCTRARVIPSSNDSESATAAQVLVKVIPSRPTLPKQLCKCHVAKPPLQKGTETLVSGERLPVVWFAYQNLSFCIYDSLDAINSSSSSATPSACFRRLDFPTQRTLAAYTSTRGYTSPTDRALAGLKWGKNDFDIPIPRFGALLREQLVAPFFVFQFFCMLLWCLDEYVYYSLLTLLMLVVFECTVVKQRQHNMETLNQMRHSPQSCLVYRMKRWVQISSDELVPGDICSISVKLQPGLRSDNNSDTNVPCDLLLLRGNCIVNESMLSGESLPLRKEALGAGLDAHELQVRLSVDDGSSLQHRKHVLFGGTKLLQHALDSDATLSSTTASQLPTPPDQGCVAFVLRTGFGTTQGSLVRTIIYSSQRVTANNAEAMWFIALLLVFAIAAAAVVLRDGLADPTRNRFKLLLHCVMIVTSVVPPELPMELSLAVTNSLVALTRCHIYCTEPFRIPFAGRIDVCCFDKTGTLTSDELKLVGVVGLETRVVASRHTSSNRSQSTSLGELDVVSPEHLPLDSELVLAGCQSLVLLNGQVVGDPLERTCVRAVEWTMGFRASHDSSTTTRMQPSFGSSRYGAIATLDIVHRFAFSSELKRMSTVVTVVYGDNDVPDERRILTKGAPEVLESLFIDAPASYKRVYRHFAARGCRVLALGHRAVPAHWSLADIRAMPRRDVECALSFAGFLVLDAPLKAHTRATIDDLVASQHQVVMVTGDNALTACDVARQVGINAAAKQPLVLTATGVDATGTVEWQAIDDGTCAFESQPFDVQAVAAMAAQYDLCATGDALAALYRQSAQPGADDNAVRESFLTTLASLCLHVTVIARTSPQQKELVITAMNRCGKTTMMCGDGTNDVGALKQAHIGISIVNAPHDERVRRDAAEHEQQQQRQHNASLHDRLQAMQHDLDNDSVSSVVRLGDASIASPFTSKSSSIRVVTQLVRHGRCTLVTTIQMYKILGVNCLVTAYYLSSLYSHGVKNGDQQLTILGLGIAMFFLFLSRAKPAQTLSRERPPTGVFCASVLVSIFGQFAIHLAALALALEAAMPFVDRADPAMHPDGPFAPSALNSVVFLLSAAMQVTTFVANYSGEPFMESFWRNKLLSRSALVAYALLAVAVAEVVPMLNATLELVVLPSPELQQRVFVLMAGDTVVTLLFEYVVQRIASRWP